MEPREVAFREKLPDEILRKGWLSVLNYLLALGDQSYPVAETRLILAGDGEQGKTSLMRALLDQAGSVSPKIDDKKSTADADSERPGGPDGPTLRLVDMVGQELYRAGHAAVLTHRCWLPVASRSVFQLILCLGLIMPDTQCQ